jgi:AbrB family looped-hinge helix DNA binding protein
MQTLATTKMTSKGQVVIPEAIRNSLHLEAGNQFVVVAHDDVVILKTIKTPSLDEFDALLRKVRSQAKAAGLKKAGIAATIKAVRTEK